MTKLIVLDNGDWIDPTIVESIQYAERSTCTVTNRVYKDRLVVWTKDKGAIPMYYESELDARVAQTNLAKQINAMRKDG